MLRIKQILCPVDFFPASIRAAEYAIALAQTYGSHLLLLHVVQPALTMPFAVPVNLGELIEAMSARATEDLNKVAKRAEVKKVTVEVVIRTGQVDYQVQRVIKSRGVDLVVMGTHGRTGLRWVRVGSTAKRLLRKLRVPLLTLTGSNSIRPGKIRRILVTTDLSEGTQDAIAFAVSLSRQFHARLTMLHVVNDLHADLAGLYRAQLIRSIHAELRNLLPGDAGESADVTVRVDVGKPVLRIRRLLKREPADLLVMNVHGKTVLERLTVGYTAERLIVRPDCPPILWVPRGTAKQLKRKSFAKAAP